MEAGPSSIMEQAAAIGNLTMATMGLAARGPVDDADGDDMPLDGHRADAAVRRARTALNPKPQTHACQGCP